MTVDASVATIGITVGILLSMLLYERTNLSAGTSFAPGIAAVLILMSPLSALAMVAAALLTGAAVMFLSERYYVFGKRRYALLMLIGMTIMAGLDAGLGFLGDAGSGYRVLGYLVPGLIGTDFQRQGIPRTMVAFLIVTAATASVVLAFIGLV